MTRQGFLWSFAALLGIVVAAAVAWSASLLAGQHIGLSSAPLSATGRLAPSAASAPAHTRSRRVEPNRHAPTSNIPAAASAPASAATTAAGAPAPAANGAPAAVAPSATPTAPAAVAPAASQPAQHEGPGRSGGGGSAQTGGGSNDSRQRDD